jgi:hypothetical protein
MTPRCQQAIAAKPKINLVTFLFVSLNVGTEPVKTTVARADMRGLVTDLTCVRREAASL